MNRKEFIAACGLFGISLPFQSVIQACSNDDETSITAGSFNGAVLIIGAGAAGMATAYLLQQQGIEYRILEADVSYGGRFRTNTSFTDFPISLGAEWLHVSESELPAIVNDGSVQINTMTQRYSASDTYGYFSNGELNVAEVGNEINSVIDQKFRNSSWFDFFEAYIVPSIRNKMQFNTEIVSIDYSGSKVTARDTQGLAYEADKLVLTVPLKILQLGKIDFTPSLPNTKQRAIAQANIWGGIKIFLKFSEKFYPTFLEFDDSETNEGQRIYYDASYAQNTSENILGLFAVGKQAEPYQNVNGEALRNYVLNELDIIFNGKASETFQDILVQNWNEQPFARAAYLADVASSSTSRAMAKSINGKLYFAGDSYTEEDDWSAVHVAARSARNAVRELIR
ncbi:FAD-dependent oxidoreductase [Muricauda sp. SCSIO 64092]|uniref:flavin monoamine oxidase family protein n=1 Tax=Allomuricauda sp. SCSIO 64092 TaxID=2908842 RepID=UPI001FF1B13B|nr:FAD-dependent oxidoreductase [Muricauda sp. SCSIO 64092]UOY08553.1 FAD-dependent oxidoreductase [Muricauda sp. SCSIO 64092]